GFSSADPTLHRHPQGLRIGHCAHSLEEDRSMADSATPGTVSDVRTVLGKERLRFQPMLTSPLAPPVLRFRTTQGDGLLLDPAQFRSTDTFGWVGDDPVPDRLPCGQRVQQRRKFPALHTPISVRETGRVEFAGALDEEGAPVPSLFHPKQQPGSLSWAATELFGGQQAHQSSVYGPSAGEVGTGLGRTGIGGDPGQPECHVSSAAYW